MWHALRTELAYFRPWLLGGLGISAGIVVLLSVLMWFDPDDGPPGFVVAMFPIIAGMVVSFIAQSYRCDEHRARLLLAGPLTPRQLAGVVVLLPTCFVGLSALAGVVMIGLVTLVTGVPEISRWTIISGFALQFLAYAQLGPLAQESSAARRQQRTGAAVFGWAVFVGAILVLAAAQFFFITGEGQLGIAMVVLTAMGVAAVLYQSRTDFTR